MASFEARRLHGQSDLNTSRDGGRVLRALVVERLNGKGRRGTRATSSATPAYAGDFLEAPPLPAARTA